MFAQAIYLATRTQKVTGLSSGTVIHSNHLFANHPCKHAVYIFEKGFMNVIHLSIKLLNANELEERS